MIREPSFSSAKRIEYHDPEATRLRERYVREVRVLLEQLETWKQRPTDSLTKQELHEYQDVITRLNRFAEILKLFGTEQNPNLTIQALHGEFLRSQERELLYELSLRDELSHRFEFDYVGAFSPEGLAVAHQEFWKKWFIDRQGNKVFGPFMDAKDFSEGYALVKHENDTVAGPNQEPQWRWSLIDASGKRITQAGEGIKAESFYHGYMVIGDYDKQVRLDHAFKASPEYHEIGKFSDGWTPVSWGFKEFGYLNVKNDVVGKYERCGEFSEGVACIRVNDVCKMIRPNGEVLKELPEYHWVYPFSEGFAIALLQSENVLITRSYCYLNHQFEPVFGPFADAYDFSCGRAFVKENSVLKCMDRTGTMLPGNWEKVGNFHDGVARVRRHGDRRDSYIDVDGNPIFYRKQP